MRSPSSFRFAAPPRLAALAGLATVSLLAPLPAHAACPAGYADINKDGNVNVIDTQCGILGNLYVLSGQVGPQPVCLAVVSNADLSCDGIVNVVDVQLSIQRALSQPFSIAIDADQNQCPDGCEAPECGNNVVELGEECDDGNKTPGDGCENDCTNTPGAVCGNNTLELGEACDDGNLVGNDGCSPNCQVEVLTPSQPGDLLITEVLYNPSAVSDNLGEWIEVLNPTTKTWNLFGLVLTDGGIDVHAIGTDVIVAPGEYVVLGRSADMAVNGGVTVDYVYANFLLGNTSDEIILVSGTTAIDSVAYGAANGFPSVNGFALSLDPGSNTILANDDGANWCAAITVFGAGDRGTPGAANPPCPVCGNGVQEGPEQCDLGAGNSDTAPNTCRTTCELPSCGDMVTDQGEDCDDGNNVLADGCEPNCTFSPPGTCGNSVIEFGEQCDDGGTLPDDGCSASCQFEEQALLPGDIVITEIMKNPLAVLDGVGEWFEVYNNTTAPINLIGFQLKEVGLEVHTIDQSVVVAPGGYAVLGVNADPLLNGGVDVDYQFSDFFLGNGDDEIILEYFGTVIDQVFYTDAAFPDADGVALSLDPVLIDADLNDDGAAWCSATVAYGAGDFGTPGMMNSDCPICGNNVLEPGEACDDGNKISNDGCENNCQLTPECGNGVVEAGEECDNGPNNSDTLPNACRTICANPFCTDGVIDSNEQCDDGNSTNGDGCSSTCQLEGVIPAVPGALVVTEIMKDPAAVSDNNGEWFEVLNTTNAPIDMLGMIIRDDGTETHTINTSLIVPPGGYRVLGRLGNSATNGGVTVHYVYTGFSLGNADDEVVIVSGTTVIDRVAYEDNTFPDVAGRSLSLSPAATDHVANDLGSNWCPAFTSYGAGDFGTPGAANAACPVCGNGAVEGFEECDAGQANSNTVPDACRTNCTAAECGDSVTDTGEQCDDGNNLSGDGCEANCTLPIVELCGNGLLDANEECDTGANNSDTVPDACRTNCVNAFCGDGVVDSGEDCDGTAGCTAQCELAGANAPAAGEVVITEIMKDPSAVADTAGEWIEIFNPSSTTTYNLAGVVLRDDGANTHTILPLSGELLLPPGGRLVLGNNGNTATNGGVNVNYVYTGFTLGNGADQVVLTFAGIEIDRVNYDDGVTFPDIPGASLSLNPSATTAALNDSGANWCQGSQAYGSGDLGTPGAANTACPVCGNGVLEFGEGCDAGMLNSDVTPDACRTTCELAGCGDAVIDSGEACDDGNTTQGDGCQNDCTLTPAIVCGNTIVEQGEQCDDGNTNPNDGCSPTCQLEAVAPAPGQLVITEIMQNPAFVADSVGEWFEVYNASNVPLNLQGLVLKDNGTNTHTIPTAVIVAPGDFAVFANNGNPSVNGGVVADYVFPTSYALGNGSDAIRIELPNGTVIDNVAWDSGASATFPVPNGASMNLRPDKFNTVDNDLGANWCLATTPLNASDEGTPGAPNTTCP